MYFIAEHYIGFVATIFLMCGLGLYSGRFVSSAQDFTIGGKSAGTVIVAGTLLGTIVGGASTVGTVQLAYSYGLSAWWFTLGAGIALLFMGMFLAKPLRRSEFQTIPELLVQGYGSSASPLTSIFSSLGIFFSLVANTLSALALLMVILPINMTTAACIVFLLVISFTLFGGIWGTGLVGIAKVAFIYVSLGVSVVIVGNASDNFTALTAGLSPFPWFSLWGRGVSKDLAAGLSLLIGMVSTQTYIQAICSAVDESTARRGTILAGILVMPTGLAGVIIGLFMRLNHPELNALQALPMFALQYLPAWFGGVLMASLLIAAVSSNAGLVLGIATMLSRDVYCRYVRPTLAENELLRISRIFIVVLAGLALLFSFGKFRSMILEWNYLSMGLRGAGIFFPLLAHVLLPGHISPRAGLYALGLGPASVLCWYNLGIEGVDPLYIGVFVSFIVMVMTTLYERFRHRR